MKTIEEQYGEQYKAIKRHYRKRKFIGALIMAVVALILLFYTYIGYKKIIEVAEVTQVMSFMFGICAAVISIRLPFHQTHSEYIQLRDLNSAYTHERFRQRKG